MAKYCTWNTQEPSFRKCSNLAEPGSYRCKEHPAKITYARVGELSRAQKEAVRKRDSHRCAICGEYANEVDHIVELSTFDYSEVWKANLPSNLQLLCEKHHKEKTKNFRKSQIPTFVTYDPTISPRANKKKRMKAEGYGVY